MPRKLKVFRTPVGFHDAYVAAPSRKAALEAWGTAADLFARGVAEEVTDPALTKAPLASPGEVIRLSRGDLAAQLKALDPKQKPAKGKAARDKPSLKATKPKPPPKRDKLDAAEAAFSEAQGRHAEETSALEGQRDAIERQLAALRARQDKESAKLESARDKAREAYRVALEKWSG